MKPKAQRIAMAELEGWEHMEAKELSPSERIVYGEKWWRNPIEKTIACEDNIPDYLNDLNAVHEVEKSLSTLNQSFFANELYDITNTGVDEEMAVTHDFFSSCVMATAAQRTEALLRTMGKWKDGE